MDVQMDVSMKEFMETVDGYSTALNQAHLSLNVAHIPHLYLMVNIYKN